MKSFPIQLVKKVTAKEAGGNWGEPTETIYYPFAELVNPSSAFRSYDAQTQLGQLKRFRIRFDFNKHPNGDWKIKFRGKDWTVVSIEQEDEKQFYWQVTANHK